MKERSFIFLVLFLAYTTSVSAADNVVVIGTGVGKVGTKENVVSIALKNPENVRGVQLQIADQPDWLKADSVMLTSRTDGFTLGYYDAEESLNIILFSTDDDITIGSGAIIDVIYSVSSEAKIGEILKLVSLNTILIDEDGKTLNVQTVNGQFHIQGTAAGVEEADTNVPNRFVLEQNFPNPFNPETRIRFSLPKDEFITIEIYNFLGQKIRTLVEERMKAGVHETAWDGRDGLGRRVSSGVYSYSLHAGEFSATKTMMLIK